MSTSFLRAVLHVSDRQNLNQHLTTVTLYLEQTQQGKQWLTSSGRLSYPPSQDYHGRQAPSSSVNLQSRILSHLRSSISFRRRRIRQPKVLLEQNGQTRQRIALRIGPRSTRIVQPGELVNVFRSVGLVPDARLPLTDRVYPMQSLVEEGGFAGEVPGIYDFR